MNCSRSLVVLTALLFFGAGTAPAQAEKAPEETTIWVTADSLLPAWGFYPLSQAYGDTRPLGEGAAWTPTGKPGTLTWVADLPENGAWHVWVRKYGGYGQVRVLVNEEPVIDGRGGPGGERYVWQHLGRTDADQGRHHIDVNISRGMIDAVLLTRDGGFEPRQENLPSPVEKPQLSALRTYRDDGPLHEHDEGRGWVVASVEDGAPLEADWLPTADQLGGPVRLWGAAGQYVNGSFAVHMLDSEQTLGAELTNVRGPQGVEFGVEQIDLRVVHIRERRRHLFRTSRVRVRTPELLLRDETTGWPPKGRQGGYGGGRCRTRIPAHQSRQFWLTIHVLPDSPPGLYRGDVMLRTAEGQSNVRLPVELEVLPLTLKPAEGYYSIYYPSQPVDPDRDNYVTPERYLAELEDQARHGLNAATLYGGFSTLELARQAGLMKAPCLMHWPGGSADEQVDEARRQGFDDLYFYGVDEPRTAEQIERCRKEAKRRRKLGLHMLTAINSTDAWEAIGDVVDRPVYNLYVFGGRDSAAAMQARQRGFRPVSYWTTATAWPLWYRGLAGLYNTACGYLGCMPWAYQDFPDERLYDPDRTVHRVTYPDESGRPIPTLAWEAHRAGIDDVRYLEALDRALAAAERQLRDRPDQAVEEALANARAVRRKHFESIDGRWFEYVCSHRPGDLDRTRRALAEATVSLEKALLEAEGSSSSAQESPGN